MFPCRRKVTIRKTNQLLLFIEIIPVYGENCAKCKCTVREKCEDSEMMKEMEHSNHCALWVN
jgi:hypothetical protein